MEGLIAFAIARNALERGYDETNRHQLSLPSSRTLQWNWHNCASLKIALKTSDILSYRYGTLAERCVTKRDNLRKAIKFCAGISKVQLQISFLKVARKTGFWLYSTFLFRLQFCCVTRRLLKSLPSDEVYFRPGKCYIKIIFTTACLEGIQKRIFKHFSFNFVSLCKEFVSQMMRKMHGI